MTLQSATSKVRYVGGGAGGSSLQGKRNNARKRGKRVWKCFGDGGGIVCERR